MCTSWSSANQISNFKFSAFFRVLFALWPLKYPRPKSQQAPRVSTELEMVINLLYSFIPLQKILQKGVDRPVENPQKSSKNMKTTSNTPNNRRMRRRNAPGAMLRAKDRTWGLRRMHKGNIFVTNCQCHICSWILTPRLFKDHLWIFGFKDHSKDNEITFFKSFVLATSANKE